MHKVWIVARHEYLTYLRRPSFLLAAFGIPVFVMVIWAVIFGVGAAQDNLDGFGDLGYVDLAGVIVADTAVPEEFPHEFVAYEERDAAQQALDEGLIGAYFVLPPEYMFSGVVEMYSYGSTPSSLNRVIREYLRANVIARLDVEMPVERLLKPVELSVVLMNTGREINEDSMILMFLMPMAFAIIYMMSSQLTSGFLMSGIVEEKTGRIMEILITSVTPMQMLTGKLLGLGALGLTQMVVWLGLGLVLTNLGNSLEVFSGVYIPAELVVFGVVYFVLSYFLLASMLAGVGVISGSEQESRQYATIFSLVTVVPFFFFMAFLEDPNGTVPVVLTLIPFTSGVAAIMRLSFGTIPPEQLVASLLLLATTTLLITWASARIFRWGTLMYGKKIGPRQIWAALRRPSREMGTVAAKSAGEVA